MNKSLLLLMSGDFTLGLLAYGTGFLLHSTGEGEPWTVELFRVAVFAGVLLLTSYLVELYVGDRYYRKGELFLRIALSLLLTLLVLGGMALMFPRFPQEGILLAAALIVFGALQFLWHSGIHLLFKIPWMAQKILILGVGPVADQIERILASGTHHYVLTGSVPLAGDPSGLIGGRESLTRFALREKIDKIVISLTERRGVLPVGDILGCKLSGIEIVDAMSFYEQMTGKLMVEKINPSWFIFSNGSRVTLFMRVYKRVLDLLFALVGLVLVTPLIPFIALAIKLDSEGPVFFQQVRVGKGEKDFTLYKFRTMHQNAEQTTGAVWARKDDPRITRVGAFLRQTRLDEVPQLFNVLKGDMSFVGPRPERPEFVARLKEEIPYYSNRHYVKPGATGWAQVKYPYGASVEDAIEKLRYDLYYIKNYSLLLDFMIILETVKVVIFGRGAR